MRFEFCLNSNSNFQSAAVASAVVSGRAAGAGTGATRGRVAGQAVLASQAVAKKALVVAR